MQASNQAERPLQWQMLFEARKLGGGGGLSKEGKRTPKVRCKLSKEAIAGNSLAATR